MKKVLFIFGQLLETDVEWIIAFGQVRRLATGDVLIREGGQLESLFIVLTGEVSVRVKALGDREVGRAGCGEILGEMSFIDSRPTSATVSAVVDSKVLAIPRLEMERKLKSDTAFAARFYRALALLLSDKVRSRSGLLPHGDSSALDAKVLAKDEIDEGVLDEVHLAGARFEGLLKRLNP